MTTNDRLAEQFESHRSRLRAVAYRLLASESDADDAVQEAWLRLSRADSGDLDNLGAWLRTVVARVCLDVLRKRQIRREDFIEPDDLLGISDSQSAPDPQDEALLAESVGVALAAVLDRLAPAERVAFVLHDLFGVQFDEIGSILDRSPAAVRQLASRARRRVQGSGIGPESDHAANRPLVAAFLAAARSGDFVALLAILSPEVVLRTSGADLPALAAREVRGAEAVAKATRDYAHLAGFARIAVVDGKLGILVVQHGRPYAALTFTAEGARIGGIDILVDAGRLQTLDITVLED